MNAIEFTRKKFAEAAKNSTAVSVQPRYTDEELKQLGLDLVREKMSKDAYASLGTADISGLRDEIQGLEIPEINTEGGYYSRPVVDTSGVADIQKRVENLSNAMKYAGFPFEKAKREAESAATALQSASEALKSAHEAYSSTPTWQAAQAYNQAVAAYQSAETKYKSAYSAYDAAYKQYKTVYDSAAEVMSAWEKYAGDSQASYDAWKGTIRDKDTVKQELDAVNAQIEELKPDTMENVAGWVADKLGIPEPFDKRIDSLHLASLEGRRKLLEEELYWSKYFDYDALKALPDFTAKSEYVPQEYRERSGMDIMMNNYADEPWDYPLYEYINGNDTAQAYLSNSASNYYGPDNAIGGVFGRATENKAESQQMEKEEVAIFNYLYATQGREAAQKYYDYLLSDLNYRQRKAEEEYWADLAAKDPFGSSAFSVIMAPTKGLSYLGQATDYLATGKIDQNASYNKFSYVNSAIRNQVAQQIKDSGEWGEVGSFAYQTGMSMLDFLMTTAISGGNGTLSMVIMGSGAAADTTIAAMDRGLTSDQAFALGTIAGVAEAVTERVSLEALLKPGNSKTVVSYILKNALAEGSEEGASTLINTVADIIISKDKSEWELSIQAYKDAGKSESEAFGLALADQAASLGLDILGGLISGGTLGSGGAAINQIGAVRTGKQIGATNPDMEKIQAMILEGLSNDPSTRSHYLAQQLQQKLLRGEQLSNTDLGKLYQANQQVDDKHRGTNVEAAQKALAEMAQKTGDSQAVGNATTSTESVEQQAKRLSEILGREIVLYSEDATEDGIRNGYYENGKIHVNTKSKDPIAQIVSHELTHSVELADAYKELSRVVLGRITASGTDLNRLRQQKAALYEANGAKLRDSGEIDREIVADYVARHLLTDEQSIVDLIREKPSLGHRILNWLNNLLAKMGNKNAQEQAFLNRAKELYVKALGQSQTSFTEETRNPENVVEYPGRQTPTNQELVEMVAWMRKQYANGDMTEEEFDSMLDSIMEYEERNNASEPAEVKHSISPTFASEVEQWNREGMPEGESLELGTTGDVLQGLGAIESDIYMLGDKIQRILLDHPEMTIEEVKKIPQILEDPVLILKSKNVGRGNAGNTRLVVFGTIKAQNGQPILAVLDLRPVEKNLVVDDMQKVSSAYTKTNNPQEFISSSDVLYADKNRTARLLRTIGFQMPIELQQSGYIGSISYLGQNVNIAGESFSNVIKISQQGDGSRQNSISSNTIRKQDVVSDLRAILNRGGGATELRQYIAEMEQNTPDAYQNNSFAEQEDEETDQTAAEAEQIVTAARRQGISVSEYLQQNWEQYDVDGRWNEAARKALEMGGGRRQYSITEPFVDNNGTQFDSAVLLDTEFFDGLNPRNWGSKLRDFVEMRAETDPLILPVTDENGNTQQLQFASSQDRVTKNGQSNHKVLDKISSGSDNISKLAVIHIDEIIDVSNADNPYYTTDNDHQWLDQNGWLHRTANVINARNGNIYNLTVDIAKARDGRHILYATNGNIKRVGNVQVNSLNIRGSGQNSNSKGNVTQTDPTVKRKDMEYQYAVSRGDMKSAQRMVDEAARKAGYSTSDDWRMAHRAPDRNSGVTIDNADEVYGGDGSIHSPLAYQYYGEGRTYDGKAIAALNKAWRDPNGSITVYRAVPMEVKDGSLRNGDWVTPTREYAKEHGERYFEEGFRILKQDVPVKHLYCDGNSIHEFGYDNGRDTEVYRNTENNVKLAEVTYDDNGNLIPLSQRFNAEKKDIRYSISGNADTETEAADAEKPEFDGAKLREEMPAKARDYLKSVERKMLNDLANKLCVPYSAKREYLLPIVEELSSEYLQNGMVSEKTAQRLFDKAYERGMVVDTEFYDQYKDIKNHMRTTAVTISDTDKADIADFADFKKRAFGLLRIVNQGGMPVDSYYRELQEMAPELFPDYITHPADQLQKMYKVAGDIRRVEKTLREYYGKEEASFRRWAKSDFDAAIADFGSELQTVKRYSEEKTAEKETQVPLTPQEAMDVYAQLKEARHNYEKVAAKNLLTEHDEAVLGDLLAGKRTLESLDSEEGNAKGITAVYEAKRELEQYSQLIAQYKRSLHKKNRDLADQHLETANEWKDKKVGIAYSRETMRRNVQDIVKDSKVAAEVNKTFFEPVAVAEAAATRFKEQYRTKVRELNLSRKVQKGNAVSEAHAVQLLGEAVDNIAMIERARGRIKHRDGKTLTEWRAVIAELWKESPGLDRKKIESAVDEFRKIYDELFVLMNEVRVANGYEPVNYRKGYFPHFQPGESDGILAHFGKALGISTDVVALPTTINGLTHTFKPGIQWFGNAQERLGFNTAYDAIEGFDKYIEGVASVIHQTENIQRLRALATQARYRTSDEGLRDQVDKVRAREDLTEEQQEALIAAIYSKGKFALSNFVVELDEYTNLLANKKSKLDRTVEAMLGRKMYTLMKWWEGRVGANMIAGNISSALTNFIPLTQAGAQLDRGALVKGMWETLRALKQSDLLVGRSDFITNRRGSDPLVKTWVQKASKVAGKPMELIDGFVSESIVRAAYYQNVKRGMSEMDAMHQADLFAANVMADRSKGAMPTLFASSNPLIKLFTQFQLEVNNQFSEVFKDLPRGFKEKSIGALALVLFKYFLGAWLFNELFEYLFGRRAALDPIGILNETVGDFTGYEIPNLLELLTGGIAGDMPSFETERLGAAEAIGNLGNNLLSELPFSSGLTLLGIETDGGRVPASSAVPDLTALKDALFNTEWSAEKRWKEASDEIAKPLTYILPPFGGNQIAKTWKGLSAYFAGGSYTVDKEGNELLQYPVFKDEAGDAFWNIVRTAIMGKSSLPEAQEWVDSGFDSFSAKQTATYQDMLAAGVKDREAYALIRELENAEKTDGVSKYQAQRKILESSSISDEGKAIAYYGLIASESDRQRMDKLAELGAESSEAGKVTMGLRDADELKGVEKKQAWSDLLIDSNLTDEEKVAVMESVLGSELLNDNGNPTQYAKLLCAIETGLPVDDYLKLYGVGADIDKYFDFADAGMKPEDAAELTFAFAELEPEDGKSTVANAQRWKLCVETFSDKEDQLAALSATMTESQFEKVSIANHYGVTPKRYVNQLSNLARYDADGNGKFTQAEVKVAVDASGGTQQQKAALWQLITGSTSAKNNPYSTAVGQAIIDELKKKRNNSDEGLSFSEEIMRQLLANM